MNIYRLVSSIALGACLCVFQSACSSGGSSGGFTPSEDSLPGTVEHRAIAGVSMGGYGALNLGTKRPGRFGAIGSLGGPIDMQALLEDIEFENLEVKPLVGIPMNVGDDFTFDLLPPYPDRDTRLDFTRDVVLAFGNPMLHHPDPSRAYLASDSEPATILEDDQWGIFTIPADPSGFLDAGDANEDGLRQTTEPPDESVEALLVAQGTIPGGGGADVGGRTLADSNMDNIYDIGDGIVLNFSEPFDDVNGNHVRDAGEAFDDFGLDGVDETDDFGEGNGSFDRDPDLDHWFAEDPLTRIQGMSAAEIQQQRIYMDVGVDDELGFARHYDNLVDVLTDKGILVDVINGFTAPNNCLTIPDIDAPYTLIRYDGGHIGFEGIDQIADDLLNQDPCGATTIWQRLIHLLSAMDAAFPGGVMGPGGIRPFGDVVTQDVASPALALGAGAAPKRTVVVYRPPAFFNTDDDLPILYFLGGHGQDPDDYAPIQLLLDPLIVAGLIENMYVAFVPGAGGTEGSFYVNHAVAESQVPSLPPADHTSGRYEDSLLDDLMPVIENAILDGRVR